MAAAILFMSTVLSVWVWFCSFPLCRRMVDTLHPPIERATQGAVTRRDLRPHDCEQIWPDLATNVQPKEAV